MTATLSGPMLPPKSGGQPKQLMVLLHGYGADGQDLISLGYQWRDLWPDMLFVSPNAPTVCDQMPTGYQWFPVGGPLPIRRVEGVESRGGRPGRRPRRRHRTRRPSQVGDAPIRPLDRGG